MKRLMLGLLLLLGCEPNADESHLSPSPQAPAPASPAPDESGPCTARSGLYRVTYRAQSGNCGPINEVVINADAPAGSGGMSACMGVGLTLDQCEGTLDTTCPIANGQIVATRGTVRWHRDAEGGSASLYIELRDATGAVTCNGIYAVTFSRF